MPYYDEDCIIDNGVQPFNEQARIAALEDALEALEARVEALEGDTENAEGGK